MFIHYFDKQLKLRVNNPMTRLTVYGNILSLKILYGVTQIAINPIILFFCGSEELGIYAYAIFISASFAIFDFGFSSYILYNNKGDELTVQQSRIFQAYERSYFALLVIVILSLMLLYICTHHYLEGRTPQTAYLFEGDFLVPTILLAIVSWPQSLYSALLINRGKTLNFFSYQLISGIIRLILVLLVVLLFKGNISLIILASSLSSLLLTLLLRREAYSVLTARFDISIKESLLVIKNNIRLHYRYTYDLVTGTVVSSLTKLSLPLFVNMSTVGFYSFVSSFNTASSYISSTTNQLEIARLSNFTSNDSERNYALEDYRNKGSLVNILTIVVPTILIVLASCEILRLLTSISTKALSPIDYYVILFGCTESISTMVNTNMVSIVGLIGRLNVLMRTRTVGLIVFCLIMYLFLQQRIQGYYIFAVPLGISASMFCYLFLELLINNTHANRKVLTYLVNDYLSLFATISALAIFRVFAKI